jgi:hypothetical protein
VFVVQREVGFQALIRPLPSALAQTDQLAIVAESEVQLVGGFGLLPGEGGQPDVVCVGNESCLELLQPKQVGRAGLDVIEPVFVLPVVAEDFLKQLLQLAEVMVGGSPFDCRHKGLLPLGRERRRILSKQRGIAADIADVISVGLLWRAVTSTVRQRFKHAVRWHSASAQVSTASMICLITLG